MANRYPIIIDTADGNKLKELPDNDSLYLSGNTITGVGNITSEATISSVNVTASGEISALTLSATDGNISNITTNSIILNDVDIETTLAGKVSSIDLAPVAFSNDYRDLSNQPSIPVDIADLTDNGQLLSVDFTDLGEVPNSFSGAGGLFLKVGLSETAIEFGTFDLTGTQVTDALGYTPYDSTNPSGYITNVITALGYTPYNETNPSGYITSVVSALGYTPYDAANPLGFISAESDTLDSVTGRGLTTTNSITTGGFTTTGATSTGTLSIDGSTVSFNFAGTVAIDGILTTTLAIGGNANLSLRDRSGSIDMQASLVPNVNATLNLGSASFNYSAIYANTLNTLQIVSSESSSWTIAGNLEITPGSATGVVRITRGGFGIPSTTTTNRNNLSVPQAGYMIQNSTLNKYQAYSGSRDIAGAGWIDLNMGEPGAQPTDNYEGKWALADGIAWNPAGNGTVRLMCYLRGGWVQIS